uniref:mevalonate kinase n=1 Tax=Ananas comosus var. bracteatus TaxID=296719 RepID=A0A6V7NTV5_ANACO|nr:unnamed protein product [Ananas comosus var. bracteatus]
MEVRARAPGKIILSGEHAVVHGSTAVAAAIDLYTHVSFRLLPPSAFSWPSSRLKETFSFEAIGPPLSPTPRPCSPEHSKLIASLVEEQNIPEAKIWLCSGIHAFLYLYTLIHGFKPGKVVISSELPLGSGLGSSAAFCVSLSGALLALSDAFSIDRQTNGLLELELSELELVNKWALAAFLLH